MRLNASTTCSEYSMRKRQVVIRVDQQHFFSRPVTSARMILS